MISATPSLSVWSLSSHHPADFESLIEQFATEYAFYGAGKVALRDGLETISVASQNVLIPAYLPDAVAEPIVEIGLEPRFYAVTESLHPNVSDIRNRIDSDTAAIVSVNYFGFPQPGLETIAELTDEYDCYHVDDNAHSPLSMHDGTLLGTDGDIGITSLWKQFPVPNGAVLYLNDTAIVDDYAPSAYEGVREHLDVSDCQFLLKSIAFELFDRNTRVRESIDTLISGSGLGRVTASPRNRYENEKSQMSKLTHRVFADADPESIRSNRRENFRTWNEVLDSRSDVVPIFDSMPEGVCPQVFPVRTADSSEFIRQLEQLGVDGANTWPRLSESVRDNPAYETSNLLSRSTVVLPVHQHIESSAIEAVGDALR
ncbi:DegT/DnrJ/EryC1/StrS family aminotransferase [Halostagnicola bangensis]